jgi:hypothetical protein
MTKSRIPSVHSSRLTSKVTISIRRRSLALIPLTCKRPIKKGDPLTRPREGRLQRAKTGFCNFVTYDRASARGANAHVRCLLEAIVPRLAEIRTIMETQNIVWRALLFEGEGKGESFADLSPELLGVAQSIGLPLEPKEPEAYKLAQPVA